MFELAKIHALLTALSSMENLNDMQIRHVMRECTKVPGVGFGGYSVDGELALRLDTGSKFELDFGTQTRTKNIVPENAMILILFRKEVGSADKQCFWVSFDIGNLRVFEGSYFAFQQFVSKFLDRNPMPENLVKILTPLEITAAMEKWMRNILYSSNFTSFKKLSIFHAFSELCQIVAGHRLIQQPNPETLNFKVDNDDIEVSYAVEWLDRSYPARAKVTIKRNGAVSTVAYDDAADFILALYNAGLTV